MISKIFLLCSVAVACHGLSLGNQKLVWPQQGYGQQSLINVPVVNVPALGLKNLQKSLPYLQQARLSGYQSVQTVKPLQKQQIIKPIVRLTPKYIDEKPQPYDMSYEIVDEYGNKQARQESGDDYGNKQGSYSMQDKNGIWRQVKYIADEQGVKMWIQTNEPGTSDANPADVDIQADPVIVQTAPVKAYKPQIVKPLY